MPYDDKMKISELRKILKEHRKTAVTPVSKMAKHQVLMELDKYAATPSSTPAPVVVEGKKAIKEEKAEVKPVSKVKVKVPMSQEPVAAIEKAAEPKKDVARVKLIKGSKEARDFMASIRMKKTKETDVS